ncbi:MAG TPA: DUF255 domain-containing protein, partial [Candidatus Methanofastidiosa archaeon]|nr:DUF255 domain-containing protein [Candidatus Methanofastidiosa archaeon]
LFFWREQCPWCQMMEDGTFADETVVQYMTENFHSVEVDIWSDERMSWTDPNIDGEYLGNLYKLNGAAPAIGFISPEEEIVLPLLGYKDVEDFLIFLEFVSSELYKEMTYSDYLESRT